MRASNKAYILAVFIGLLAGGARAQTSVNKPVILQQLTRTSLSRLQPTAKHLSGSYRKTTAQLELDLIVFRWISHSLKMPKDIKNADVIISTLQKSLNDPIIDYAAEVFCVDSRARTSLRPSAESALIASLEQLKSQVEDGLASRESSPARSVDYFVAAAKLCQAASLDISEAAISKELGDIHHYDMSRYRQAESFYDRASTTFQAYRCPASGATVYDGWGMLSMSVGKYTDSAERYIQAARQWENLIKEDPSQFRNRDKAGLAYIRAGKAKEADGDYPGALELMRSHGLFQLRNYAYATKSYELLVKNLLTFSVFVRERMGETKDAVAVLNEARSAASLQGDHLLLGQQLLHGGRRLRPVEGDLALEQRPVRPGHLGQESPLAIALLERVGSVQRHDLAFVDEGHSICQAIRLQHVVRGEEDGGAPLALLQDHAADGRRRVGVQSLGWFVQEEDARVVDQGAGDHQALLHALRVRFHSILASTIKADTLEQCHWVRVGHAKEPGEQLEVVHGAHLLVQVRDFKAHADLALYLLSLPGHVQAQQRGLALPGAQLTGQHLDRGGLAGAVRAQEPEDLAFGDREGYVVDCR